MPSEVSLAPPQEILLVLAHVAGRWETTGLAQHMCDASPLVLSACSWRPGGPAVPSGSPVPMRRALTLVSRRVAAFESRPPSAGALAWRPASHYRSCASSSKGVQTGPDASRGYNVSEYSGLWRTLNELEPEWPSRQTVAVVGPIGDGFAASALACAHDVVGREAATVVSTQPRSRWQSVRLQVVCRSPDDVCELHSRLRALEGVRAVV